MMKDLKNMLRRCLRQQLPLAAAALLLTLVQCVLDLLLPRMMANAVNNGVMRGDLSFLTKTGLHMLAASACLGLAGYGASLFCAVAGERFALSLRTEAYDKIQTLSVRQVSSVGYGSMITRLTVDIEVCAGLIHAVILFLAEPLCLMFGGVFMMWLISRRLGLVFIAFVVLQLLVMLFFIRLTAGDYAKVRALTDALNGRVQDVLGHFRMTKAFNAQEMEKDGFEGDCAALFDAMFRVQRKIAVFNPLIMLIMNLAIAASLWISGVQVAAGALELGSVLSAITYSEQVLLSIAACGRMYKVIVEAQPSAARIFALLDTQPELQEGSCALDEPFRELRFEQVDYALPGGAAILHAVSFRLRAGEHLAVVGPVSSGKSTLAGLCVRLWDPVAGQVLLNGQDLRSLHLNAVRAVTALVDRQSAVLEGSVRENIVFGRDGIEADAVSRALSAAQLTAYIQKSAKGLDSHLRSMGHSMSGGEKQRLTIARALAGDPGLLVLDDSTSCLDYETEGQLLAALRRDYPATAVLLITNRTVSAEKADRILVLDDGRVIAEGRACDLKKSCVLYQSLCSAQDR